MSTEERVQLVGAEPSGLAEMLSAIVRSNLEQHPDRARFLDGRPGTVRIDATDAGVIVVLDFRDGALRIHSEPGRGRPDVHVQADSATLAAFGSVPQLGPLPHPFRPEGRAVLRKAVRGEIKVTGAVRGAGLLKRMRGLLTTDPA